MIRKPLVTHSISELQRYIRPRIASSGHAHFWRRAAALSRRNFLQAGATLAAGLAIPPALCASREPSLPNPIPGGLDLLGTGQIFHVFLPGTSPELATITDFNGAMGATDVLGTWTAEGFTPPPDTPIIFDADVRFMSGEYIGRDTKHHQGAFAFVWIDLYVGLETPDFRNQVHDFDPGLDNGLFWTIPVSADSVTVNPGSGRASLVVKDLVMEDYFNIVNALNDGSSNSATVSLEVHWATGVKHFKVRDEATGMAGEFLMNTATMAWSVESNGIAYQSGPENTSASISGQVGHERNGVFFK